MGSLDRESLVRQKFAKVREAISDGMKAAGEAYANGLFRAMPIVDAHFTAGNDKRNGWPPLSPAYAEAKRQAGPALRKGMRAAGRKVSKYDEDQFGGNILPMLVRTGALREAVDSRTHAVSVDPTTGRITVRFSGLPEYAKYLHDGTPKMPKRSPVEPNLEDREMVILELRRFLDRRFQQMRGFARVGSPTI